jgi:hypothetical protein
LTGSFLEKRFIWDLFKCSDGKGKHSSNGQELAVRILQISKKVNPDVDMELSETGAVEIRHSKKSSVLFFAYHNFSSFNRSKL